MAYQVFLGTEASISKTSHRIPRLKRLPSCFGEANSRQGTNLAHFKENFRRIELFLPTFFHCSRTFQKEQTLWKQSGPRLPSQLLTLERKQRVSKMRTIVRLWSFSPAWPPWLRLMSEFATASAPSNPKNPWDTLPTFYF